MLDGDGTAAEGAADLGWLGGDKGLGTHPDPKPSAAGCRLPGEMFASREPAFLHLSVIRAGLQAQRESEAEDRDMGLLQSPKLLEAIGAVPKQAPGSPLPSTPRALGFWKKIQREEMELELWPLRTAGEGAWVDLGSSSTTSTSPLQISLFSPKFPSDTVC